MLQTGFWMPFCLQIFQNHILIEATRYTLPFGAAIYMSGSEFLKKTAYNTLFAVKYIKQYLAF